MSHPQKVKLSTASLEGRSQKLCHVKYPRDQAGLGGRTEQKLLNPHGKLFAFVLPASIFLVHTILYSRFRIKMCCLSARDVSFSYSQLGVEQECFLGVVLGLGFFLVGFHSDCIPISLPYALDNFLWITKFSIILKLDCLVF